MRCALRFPSQDAAERFLGYMHSQHERMLGQSTHNVPNRPELIARHGWDVTYGSHALRLTYQGHEIAAVRTLLDEGRTPLPAKADTERVEQWAIQAQRERSSW